MGKAEGQTCSTSGASYAHRKLYWRKRTGKSNIIISVQERERERERERHIVCAPLGNKAQKCSDNGFYLLSLFIWYWHFHSKLLFNLHTVLQYRLSTRREKEREREIDYIKEKRKEKLRDKRVSWACSIHEHPFTLINAKCK
jgi:hypothetical protein